tara:strand:+ start:5416 stop:6012 length:597 start_codon:yes stop_codon:yes gene_type:complete
VKINLKSILIYIASILIVVFAVRMCSPAKLKKVYKTNTEVISHTDTVYKSLIDTVYIESEVKYIYQDRYVEVVNEDSSIDFIHQYSTNDLNAEVTTTFNDNEVINQSLEYSIIYPEITKTDTIIITNTDSIIVTNIVDRNRMNFYLGSSAAVLDGTLTSVGLNATLQLKNQVQIGYEYGIRIDAPNEHRAVIKFPLRR